MAREGDIMTPETRDAHRTAANLHLLASHLECHACVLTNERLRDAYIDAVLKLTDAADALDCAVQDVDGVWAVLDERQMEVEWA
jgi:hypothetical protein